MSTFLSILPIIIALVLYFTGIPIAYALFAAALTYFGFIDTTTVPYLLMQKFVTATQSFPFLAIPFFIMCGSIMNYGGISARLMDFADALTGHLPGGLAQINVLLSMLMGGCSGSANADAAMECKLLVPEMEKRGYGKGFSAAITAASSCVTPIIPPGINLIVYGLIAGIMMRCVRTRHVYADLYISLIVAIVAGRVVNGLVNALIFARGSYSMATWVAGSVVKSWPGTVIQLVFIPSIVFALMKARLIPERYPKEVPADD